MRAGKSLPPLAESRMTEPMIEQTEAEIEEFTDELSDGALDRQETELLCAVTSCRAPVTDR
jgi:hypothetical protein